jgi:hypothetical protein
MNQCERNGSPGRGRGRRRSWPRWAPALAALALLGLLATACGGGSSPAPSGAGGRGGGEGALAYARCMRAHGVPDFPDPDSHGQFSPRPVTSQETAAHQVCRHLLKAGSPPDAAQRQHMLDQLLKYARCMRAHGVPNFADPQATGGEIGVGGPVSDHNSPQYQAADHACHSLAASAKGRGKS